MSWPRSAAAKTLLAIAISAVGGFAINATGAPAGWLMGGSLAVAIAALLGVGVHIPRWLRDFTFVMTGLSMGTNVARDSLSLLAQWPVTVAALAIELALIIGLTGYMLRKLFKLDPGTAYLSSFPGHLSFVMGIAAAGVGDPRQITIIQVIRILLLTVCVPIGAMFLPVGHGLLERDTHVASLPDLALIGSVCLATGFVFTRLGVPAGYALGAMAAATIAKFTGNLDGVMPPLLLTGSYILLGALMGARFAGITLQEFGKAAVGGLIATAMVAAICTVVALGASTLVDMPFGQIWLGIAPGALEGMGALGIALGFDTAFIAAHHVARLLLLTIAIPLVVMIVRPRQTD